MKLQAKAFMLTAVVAGLMLPVAAQTAPAPPPGTIHQRKENQQDRIAQGSQERAVDRGRNRPPGKNREAKINKEVHNERVANGGKLTRSRTAAGQPPAEPHFARIYRKKHNARGYSKFDSASVRRLRKRRRFSCGRERPARAGFQKRTSPGKHELSNARGWRSSQLPARIPVYRSRSG